MADAGPDQSVSAGDTVTLDGSGSSDIEGTPLTFQWEFDSRPNGSGAMLSDPAAVNPTFTADLSGIYSVLLVVNDGTEDSHSDQVAVTAEPLMVQVPAVVGMLQADAEVAIAGVGLSPGTIDTESSDTVPAGHVISQTPAAKTQVPPGSAIDLVVSLGLESVAVPDVVGQTQAGAEATILAANLVVGTINTEHSDSVPAGTVIRHNPAAGTSVAGGSAVDLVVSLGPALANVPDVVGQPQPDAEAAIIAAGLVVGAVTQEHSDTIPAGNVIGQNPSGGASVTPGSLVDIAVSQGPGIQPPTASITADPMEINPGGTSTLTWTTSNAGTVNIDPVIGSVGSTGSIPVILESTVTFTITATNDAGTVSDSVTVVVNTSTTVSVHITSPLNNDTLSKPYILVEGFVSNPNDEEVGVNVNGVIALVNGDQFVARNIPLIEGENTIAATVTDGNGNSASDTISVYRDSGEYLKITASTQSSVSPLETILKVGGSFPITSLSISYSGPGALDSFESISNNEFSVSMSVIGLYYFFADATDAENNTYTDVVVVQVMDKDEMDVLLQTKWNGMKNSLAAGDIQGALNHFHSGTRDDFEFIFNALTPQRLNEIGITMREIELIYIRENIAKYRIKREEVINGTTYDITYYLYFSEDGRGIWKILRF